MYDRSRCCEVHKGYTCTDIKSHVGVWTKSAATDQAKPTRGKPGVCPRTRVAKYLMYIGRFPTRTRSCMFVFVAIGPCEVPPLEKAPFSLF